MLEIGYKLSSEEFRPDELVRNAKRAEETGFTFAMISDHFHPWIDRQGQSPFVWAVIGGIAQATTALVLGTAVTCPTMRVHPGIIAQAAATAASMMPGRFILGLGTGENLNEHIFGHRWPPAAIRQEMLKEAVEVIRRLWSGSQESFYGEYYTVENARIYTLPEKLPAVMLAASGSSAAQMAGEIADGLISTTPQSELIDTFHRSGGAGKPRYAEVSVCWAKDEKEARKLALECWPIAGLKGPLTTELATPAQFEETAAMVGENDLVEKIPCGPDPERHIRSIKSYADAGFDHIFVHQIGPDQDGFFDFYRRDVLPRLS
jgi:coenzyme F420-dependent glucose-6-phosphate dehydrogenase